jgi:hypothetical protein
MDEYGYPTKGELYNIRNWNVVTRESLFNLLRYLEERWRYADLGYFKLTGTNVLKLELHTGGWSGNESIIDALQNNQLFWFMGWEKSTRGGHFWFKFRIELFRTEEEYEYAKEDERIHTDRADDRNSDNRDPGRGDNPESPTGIAQGSGKEEGPGPQIPSGEGTGGGEGTAPAGGEDPF